MNFIFNPKDSHKYTYIILLQFIIGLSIFKHLNPIVYALHKKAKQIQLM